MTGSSRARRRRSAAGIQARSAWSPGGRSPCARPWPRGARCGPCAGRPRPAPAPAFRRDCAGPARMTQIAQRPHALELLLHLDLAFLVEKRQPPFAQEQHEAGEVEAQSHNGQPLLGHGVSRSPRTPSIPRALRRREQTDLLGPHHQTIDAEALEFSADAGRCRLCVEAGVAGAIENLVALPELAGYRRTRLLSKDLRAAGLRRVGVRLRSGSGRRRSGCGRRRWRLPAGQGPTPSSGAAAEPDAAPGAQQGLDAIGGGEPGAAADAVLPVPAPGAHVRSRRSAAGVTPAATGRCAGCGAGAAMAIRGASWPARRERGAGLRVFSFEAFISPMLR